MADWPRITLVTPSFQQATFVERTLRSVLDQGYPNLEYMVVDGGSTDGTVEILERYSDRLTWWVSERDSGQSNAINKGLRRATGDIVGWLNSDDTLARGALRRIGRYYQRHPNVDLLYGHVCIIDSEDRVIRRLVAVPTNASELIRFNRNLWSQPGTTWRRALQERIGLLDESLHFTMDGDYWIRAALNGRVSCLPAHLANLRSHPDTKTRSQADRFDLEASELVRRYGAPAQMPYEVRLFGVRRAWRVLRDPRNWVYRLGLTG